MLGRYRGSQSCAYRNFRQQASAYLDFGRPGSRGGRRGSRTSCRRATAGGGRRRRLGGGRWRGCEGGWSSIYNGHAHIFECRSINNVPTLIYLYSCVQYSRQRTRLPPPNTHTKISVIQPMSIQPRFLSHPQLRGPQSFIALRTQLHVWRAPNIYPAATQSLARSRWLSIVGPQYSELCLCLGGQWRRAQGHPVGQSRSVLSNALKGGFDPMA